MSSYLNEISFNRQEILEPRILMVDDDRDDFILQNDMILENIKDAKLSYASNPDSALDLLIEHEFDLAIFDFHLGAINGLQLLKSARELGFVKPVILLTGNGDEELAVRAIKSGSADYLSKRNLDSEKICKAVRKAIREDLAMNLMLGDFA